jgi:hypothetical protein
MHVLLTALQEFGIAQAICSLGNAENGETFVAKIDGF